MSLHTVIVGNPMTEKWECQSSVDIMNGTRCYSVINTEPKAKRTTHWGPFYSEEEAYRVSGMPRPKTELEEVWELLDSAHARIKSYECPKYCDVRLSEKIAELKAKWKK